MNTIVGFSIFNILEAHRIKRLFAAQERALALFKHLKRKTLSLGLTHLEIWGHGDLNARLHTLPDGSLLALIGSPHGEINWLKVEEVLSEDEKAAGFELPWDGRVVLLRVSADGCRWTMWNDWVGSIPVYHAKIGDGNIASTLEPLTVAAAGYTPDDIFLPGLLSLLINGYFLSDWTLYRDMKVLLPDSVSEWNERGFTSRCLWTVEPTRDRWETGWDDLVDEMHEFSHRAIAKVLKTQKNWILPLSSGLDSKLIAGVAAEVGTDLRTYAWGARNTTDVVFSRQIARTLGFPWKRVDLQKDFLVKYTPHWADMFGSSMHFHGMYVMCFLDAIKSESSGQILLGFLGDILAGDNVTPLVLNHAVPGRSQILGEWYTYWNVEQIKTHIKVPINEALEELSAEIKNQIDTAKGAWFQKLLFLEIWNLERLFISYQPILADYWRGVSTPLLDRDYARFCMSLPRVALDDRRLLADVYRRYYGRLAVIPGTYYKEPYIVTGKYRVKRLIFDKLPPVFHRGPLAGIGNVQLRMDTISVQASGRTALWPLFEARDRLSSWLDFTQLERDFQTVMTSKDDIRPLRRLQSAQTLAFRLISKNEGTML